MPSPDQQQASKDRQAQAALLKVKYQELDGGPVMLDILGYLEAGYQRDYVAAVNATDNPAQALGLLQSANAYDTIRTHIRKQLQ